MVSSSCKIALVAALAVAATAAARGAGAQRAAAVAAAADAPSVVSGRVVRPGADSMVPLANHWVTLHRVGSDAAGPLDSTRTSAGGRYAITYPRTEDDSAVFFVSSTYGGVAYFTAPLQRGRVDGDDAEIVVFDTTSAPVRTSVRGRHVIVTAPRGGGERTVTEVFELSNDSSVTRVAAGNDLRQAVWASLLPHAARKPSVGAGDVPAAAVRFVANHAAIYSPFAPGVKQFVYSYLLDGGAFPLEFPLERATSVLEVLVEEPGAKVDAPKLREVAPVTIEGHHFRRFLGMDVPAAGVVTVTVPSSGAAVNPWFVALLTAIIGGAMTVALARAVRRR